MPQAPRGFAGLRLKASELFARARREHSSPREIGLSVGIGVFCACTPFLGLHMWMALAAATLLRLNRLWAFLASRASVTPIFLWITFCEIEIAHRLRSGAWASLAPREALSHGPALLTDWLIGSAIVGGLLGVAAGSVAYAWARSRLSAQPNDAEGAPQPALSSHTPGGLRPPTSGSLRSTPLDPHP
jgi:uncharacterized protein (DUF2062 family)